jgi:hypothetical protein
MREQATGKLFFARDYVKAVKHKEDTGGLLFRAYYRDQIVYEVKYLPPPEPGEVKYYNAVIERRLALKKWPVWIHYFIAIGKYNNPNK